MSEFSEKYTLGEDLFNPEFEANYLVQLRTEFEQACTHLRANTCIDLSRKGAMSGKYGGAYFAFKEFHPLASSSTFENGLDNALVLVEDQGDLPSAISIITNESLPPEPVKGNQGIITKEFRLTGNNHVFFHTGSLLFDRDTSEFTGGDKEGNGTPYIIPKPPDSIIVAFPGKVFSSEKISYTYNNDKSAEVRLHDPASHFDCLDVLSYANGILEMIQPLTPEIALRFKG